MTGVPGIFCAVDKNNLAAAKELVAMLSPLPLHIKLGLEFFVAEGPQGVAAIRAMLPASAKIFLDLKLHDIPNTVAGAVRAAAAAGVDFLTLHAGGGHEMMRAAVLAAQDVAQATGRPAPCLLGVTVLTHMDARDLSGIGIDAAPADQVLRLARLAAEAGMGGAVCAPQEIAALRAALPADFKLVVPGIRPAGNAAGDQKRIMTPEEAGKLGADYLVIGRPITEAADPVAAAGAILAALAAKAA
jgi:orotidine-5'-phosphate decarboxylase